MSKSKWKCADDTCVNKCEVSEEYGEKPKNCPYSGEVIKWEPVEIGSNPELFGISEQLPKLTADVFHLPDCPDWAKYAAVDKYKKAMWYEDEPKAIGRVFWNSKRGQIKEIPGKFDASDWQNSLIERLPETVPEPEETDGALTIRFKKLHPDAKAPFQATLGSAGYDLTAVYMEPVAHTHRRIVKYGTGLAVEIPSGYVGLVFPRSSVYKADVQMANCVGVIDSDYRGEITAVFYVDLTSENYAKGDRIAQLVIMPIPAVKFVEAEELTDTERGIGGYGSTGR